MNPEPLASLKQAIWDSATAGRVPFMHALCFILGWQGGTVYQVAEALGVQTGDILNANEEKQGDLMRKAQLVKWTWQATGDVNALAIKHLRLCVDALKADYQGHTLPPFIERADGVCRILEETLQ